MITSRRRHLTAAGAVAATAVAAAVAVTVPPASARAATAPAIRFGLAPVPAASGKPRPYFELTITPGTAGQDKVLVSNSGTSTAVLKIGGVNGITAANSGSAFTGVSGRCAGAGCWVTGLPATVTLPPGTGRVLGFRVAVPPRTAPGQYLAGITAQPAAAPRPVTAGLAQGGSASVIIVSQVTVGVAVTVGTLARLHARLAVTAVTAGWIGSMPRLNIHVRNPGQLFTRARGTISCRVSGTRRRFPVIMDTVLPGDGAALPVNAPGMRAGPLPCTVSLRATGGVTATWSGTVTVPATGPAVTRRVGNGVYAALPAGGVPAWAVAVIAVGTLLTVVLSSLLVLLWKRRPGRL